MKNVLATLLFIFAVSGFDLNPFAQRNARPFKISFEMNGKKIETSLTLRIKHEGKVAEIKYAANEPIEFPKLKPGKRFDLWIITDDYTFPFLDMHPDALTVAGWRIGVDVRPFHLDYMEFRLMRSDIKLVYYMIYQHADGGETPIWIECQQSLKDFRTNVNSQQIVGPERRERVL
jgi:hypothetical protein